MVHFDFSGKKGACNIRVQIEPSDAVTTSGHSLLQTTLTAHTAQCTHTPHTTHCTLHTPHTHLLSPSCSRLCFRDQQIPFEIWKQVLLIHRKGVKQLLPRKKLFDFWLWFMNINDQKNLRPTPPSPPVIHKISVIFESDQKRETSSWHLSRFVHINSNCLTEMAF